MLRARATTYPEKLVISIDSPEEYVVINWRVLFFRCQMSHHSYFQCICVVDTTSRPEPVLFSNNYCRMKPLDPHGRMLRQCRWSWMTLRPIRKTRWEEEPWRTQFVSIIIATSFEQQLKLARNNWRFGRNDLCETYLFCTKVIGHQYVRWIRSLCTLRYCYEFPSLIIGTKVWVFSEK